MARTHEVGKDQSFPLICAQVTQAVAGRDISIITNVTSCHQPLQEELAARWVHQGGKMGMMHYTSPLHEP